MIFLLFGTGRLYNKYKSFFPHGTIKALLDNDLKKQGTVIDGVPVMSPEEGIQLSYDFIFILTKYEHEIRVQLQDLGVEAEWICNYRDISRFCTSENNIRYIGDVTSVRGNRQGCVLLMTHCMEFSGAAMALFSLGDILIHNGYRVAVASEFDNEKVRLWLVSLGMDVLIAPDIGIGSLADLPWVREYDLVIVNTICLYYLLRRRGKAVPVLWWLHDADEYYEGIPVADLKQIVALRDNLKIVAVSEIAKYYFCQRVEEAVIEKLPYGINDFYVREDSTSGKCVFAIVGDVIPRKGTDIFLAAAEVIGKRYSENVEFWIIGNDSADFAQSIRRTSAAIPCVKMFGKVPHDELEKLYHSITALVVPSRDDILPIVAVEAMLNHIGCIISDNNDIASYVHDYNAGFVCPVDCVEDWIVSMEWVISHRDKWKDVGHNGRAIYDKYFSMNVFQQNVLGIVRQMVKDG